MSGWSFVTVVLVVLFSDVVRVRVFAALKRRRGVRAELAALRRRLTTIRESADSAPWAHTTLALERLRVDTYRTLARSCTRVSEKMEALAIIHAAETALQRRPGDSRA